MSVIDSTLLILLSAAAGLGAVLTFLASRLFFRARIESAYRRGQEEVFVRRSDGEERLEQLQALLNQRDLDLDQVRKELQQAQTATTSVDARQFERALEENKALRRRLVELGKRINPKDTILDADVLLGPNEAITETLVDAAPSGEHSNALEMVTMHLQKVQQLVNDSLKICTRSRPPARSEEQDQSPSNEAKERIKQTVN